MLSLHTDWPLKSNVLKIVRSNELQYMSYCWKRTRTVCEIPGELNWLIITIPFSTFIEGGNNDSVSVNWAEFSELFSNVCSANVRLMAVSCWLFYEF